MPAESRQRGPRRPWLKRFPWLRFVPVIGRMRALRPGADALVGPVIDAFAAFATLDEQFDPLEADIALDLLRNAFPEADHGWLARRLQRAVRQPRSLNHIAADIQPWLDDTGTVVLALQLYTLVDAAGRSERSRGSFEIFMRRLGRPELGQAVLHEMLGGGDGAPPPFERLAFAGDASGDVALPPAAEGCSFHLYRAGDLVLVRNTGTRPIWLRGRSLEPGAFLRMREHQQLEVPGWTLTHADLVFFLNVARTGVRRSIYLCADEDGLHAEPARSRQSVVQIGFGLDAEVVALHATPVRVGDRPLGRPAAGPLRVPHHERLVDNAGLDIGLDDLRRLALKHGRRFRLASDRQQLRVSNDPAEIGPGDLLVTPGLAERFVLEIAYDARSATGRLKILKALAPLQVDGAPARGECELRDGSLIRLSANQAVRCRFNERLLDEERTVIRSLAVEDLKHSFGTSGRALDNLNFEVLRGEMLCIIGPSGSGKSTLLATLSSQLRPEGGRVRINGIDLYQHRRRLAPCIAYMPQEEALNPQLTVREHLRHASSIRRPHLALPEHERRVDGLLVELGLQPLARRRVGAPGEKTISGGERSRLNLGLDLGSAAEVFLFDEPISGLSSKDSEHVVQTLRALSRDKIIAASLHRPGAQVLRLFDKVLLLDTGGRLAFFGTPDAMIAYFREACLELAIPHPAVAGDAPLGADFVFDVLEVPLQRLGGGQSPAAARRFPARFWQERFESLALVRAVRAAPQPPTRLSSAAPGAGPQPLPRPRRPTLREVAPLWQTHFHRALLSKVRNRGTIYSTLLEAPLLAALIGLTLRSSPEGAYRFATALHLPAYLFLTATVGMFLGLTNSATEVLRDRPVLRRERNTHPEAGLYITAKFAALALVAGAQCLVYQLIGNALLGLGGLTLEHWGWMTATACTGTAMALLVSTLVRSERAALTAVPLLLVPQMLLAGALVPFGDMNRALFKDSELSRERGGTPVPAVIMPLRYAYEAMVVTQATRNPFDLARHRIQRRIDLLRGDRGGGGAATAERLGVLKSALTRLVASGAGNRRDARRVLSRLAALARTGTLAEVETLDVWPDDDPGACPSSDYFVNERIDLMVREAESYRTDYRSPARRNIFLAETKYCLGSEVGTLEATGAVLLGTTLACLVAAAAALRLQNESVGS